MAKRRKKLDEDSKNKKNVSAYKPFFSPDFKADLRWWYRNESKVGDKILDLVGDILTENPFAGIGKPEPLKYMGANIWSRRITLEHRLLYRVVEDKIYFLQARYHYQK